MAQSFTPSTQGPFAAAAPPAVSAAATTWVGWARLTDRGGRSEPPAGKYGSEPCHDGFRTPNHQQGARISPVRCDFRHRFAFAPRQSGRRSGMIPTTLCPTFRLHSLTLLPPGTQLCVRRDRERLSLLPFVRRPSRRFRCRFNAPAPPTGLARPRPQPPMPHDRPPAWIKAQATGPPGVDPFYLAPSRGRPAAILESSPDKASGWSDLRRSFLYSASQLLHPRLLP